MPTSSLARITSRRAKKTNVLSPFQHPSQPVKRRVRVASPNTLNQRANRVIVGVAIAIESNRLLLKRFGRQLLGKLDRPFIGRKNADLQRRKRVPRVAVARLGEELQRVVVQTDIDLPQPSVGIGRRATQEFLDILVRERLELENTTPTD